MQSLARESSTDYSKSGSIPKKVRQPKVAIKIRTEPDGQVLSLVGREAWLVKRLIAAGDRGCSSLDNIGTQGLALRFQVPGIRPNHHDRACPPRGRLSGVARRLSPRHELYGSRRLCGGRIMSAARGKEQVAAFGSPSITLAAQWLATGGGDKSRSIVPQLRQEFSLSPKEAVDAIREADLIRARAS